MAYLILFASTVYFVLGGSEEPDLGNVQMVQISHQKEDKLNKNFYIAAEKHLLAGESALHHQDHTGAIHHFRLGISILGTYYISPNFVDDTGMRIVLANFEEGNGKLDICANLLRNVLSERLKVSNEKHINEERGSEKREGKHIND